MSGERGTWGPFLVWALVGAVAMFGAVDFPPLGALVILIAAIVVVTIPSTRRSAFGVLAGVGALSLRISYVQRLGPGTVCWRTARASGCGDYLDPRPWLVAGVVLVVVAFVKQLRRHHETGLRLGA